MTDNADPYKWQPVRDEVVANPEMVKIVPNRRKKEQSNEVLEAEYSVNSTMKPKGMSEKQALYLVDKARLQAKDMSERDMNKLARLQKEAYSDTPDVSYQEAPKKRRRKSKKPKAEG